MGKYDKVVGGLEVAPEEPAYQEQIDILKKGINARGFSDLARIFVEVKKKKAEYEDAIKGTDLQLAALTQLLEVAAEEEEIDSVRLSIGKSVTVGQLPIPVTEDKDKFREWCLKEGLERSLSLPYMTTQSILRERLLKGEPEPDGLKAYLKTKISVRKI